LEPYPRRIYPRPGLFFKDLQELLKHRGAIKRAGEGVISAAFRERLIMVVTAVNDCRYCRRFHQTLAEKTGVPGKELEVINQGLIPADAPPSELPALYYARAWAEANAAPGQDHVKALGDHYSPEEIKAIHGILYMIRVGNLMGNTFDYVLYQLTRGRRGGTRQPQTVVNPDPEYEEKL